MPEFIIPADYCVALVDLESYPSFLDENWTLEQIYNHFVNQMNKGTMISWGTGAPGNWNVHCEKQMGLAQGYREFSAQIFTASSRLYFTSYDELTWAAQHEDNNLPDQGSDAWFLEIEPGEYKCRVVQLYNPIDSESEKVFYQKEPHFTLEFSRGISEKISFERVPWFIEP